MIPIIDHSIVEIEAWKVEILRLCCLLLIIEFIALISYSIYVFINDRKKERKLEKMKTNEKVFLACVKALNGFGKVWKVIDECVEEFDGNINHLIQLDLGKGNSIQNLEWYVRMLSFHYEENGSFNLDLKMILEILKIDIKIINQFKLYDFCPYYSINKWNEILREKIISYYQLNVEEVN